MEAKDITAETVVSVYPYPLKRSRGAHDMYYGPCWHCGGKDRFQLYTGLDNKLHWGCRQSRERNTHGSRLSYYFYADWLYYELTGDMSYISEAVYYKAFGEWRDPEATQTRLAFVRTKPLVSAMPDPPTWNNNDIQMTLDDVRRYQNAEAALRYFGKFGISQRTLHQVDIGYTVKPKHCSLPAGYVIPNIAHGPNGQLGLRGVQIRRDEAACRRALEAHGPDWIRQETSKLADVWLDQIAQGARSSLPVPTISDLVEWTYPKYASITGSQNGIWGDDLITLPDNSRIGPKLEYIFMTEDAKSTLVLREAGYPAVAYKPRADWNFWLPRVFKRCRRVIVIADRDEEENNRGVGLEMARKIEDFIHVGRLSDTRVVLPPEGRNDVADLVRDDGFDALHSWIDSNIPGTQPVLEGAA